MGLSRAEVVEGNGGKSVVQVCNTSSEIHKNKKIEETLNDIKERSKTNLRPIREIFEDKYITGGECDNVGKLWET